MSQVHKACGHHSGSTNNLVQALPAAECAASKISCGDDVGREVNLSKPYLLLIWCSKNHAWPLKCLGSEARSRCGRGWCLLAYSVLVGVESNAYTLLGASTPSGMRRAVQ